MVTRLDDVVGPRGLGFRFVQQGHNDAPGRPGDFAQLPSGRGTVCLDRDLDDGFIAGNGRLLR